MALVKLSVDPLSILTRTLQSQKMKDKTKKTVGFFFVGGGGGCAMLWKNQFAEIA